jgi:hypothetical protein
MTETAPLVVKRAGRFSCTRTSAGSLRDLRSKPTSTTGKNGHFEASVEQKQPPGNRRAQLNAVF